MKKVRTKTIEDLKPYSQPLPRGDMDENQYYCVLMGNKELVKSKFSLNDVGNAFTIKPLHWAEHDAEFLVVDHPNPISKKEYEHLKSLFVEEEIEVENTGLSEREQEMAQMLQEFIDTNLFDNTPPTDSDISIVQLKSKAKLLLNKLGILQ